MEILRDRLAKRKKKFKKDKTGFFWFQESPWFSTLLPTVITPLIIVFLALTLGPWALSLLTRFVKSQIDSALKPAEVHYHCLAAEEDDAAADVLTKIVLPLPEDPFPSPNSLPVSTSNS